jgi:hypothetical protein
MRRRSVFALPFAAAGPASAATLDGVTLPDTRVLDGTTLRLNGMAARTYTVFRVTVYVAGLYLERPLSDAAAILASAAPKLIAIRYRRAVDEADVRRAWRALLEANCGSPCAIAPPAIERFIGLCQAVREGTEESYALTAAGVTLNADGRALGSAPGPDLARLVLATFIGPAPTSEAVRDGLLGRRAS